MDDLFLNQKTNNRHFSHVPKSRISKNLNLRKKAGRKLSPHFPEKPFQAPKIIFKSPKLIGQRSLSYGHLLKDERLKFTFLRGPTFQVFGTWNFPAKEDLIRRKQVFLLDFRPWPTQKPNIWSIFCGKQFKQENSVV